MRKFILSIALAVLLVGSAAMSSADAQWRHRRAYYYGYPSYSYPYYSYPFYSYPGASYYYTPYATYDYPTWGYYR